MDKSHERAKQTKERNKALRETRRAAFNAEKDRDKPLVIEALRAVLIDDKATTEQRLFAVTALDEIQGYGFIPYRRKHVSAITAAMVPRLRGDDKEKNE